MHSKSIDQVTILSGDRGRLEHLLRTRLLECGWNAQVQLLCRKAIVDSGETNVDNLVQKVTPEARSLIPDVVKQELLEKIRLIAMEQMRRDKMKKQGDMKKKDTVRKKEEQKKKDSSK